MTAAISYTSIESNAFNNILDILNTRTYIADPRDPNNEKLRDWVYDADPFMTALDLGPLPYIFCEPPQINQPRDMESLNTKKKHVMWSHRIVVRTLRERNSGTNVQVGRSDMNNITDDILQTFNSRAVRDILRLKGIKNIECKKVGATNDVIDNQHVYESEFELTYHQHMTTSV